LKTPHIIIISGPNGAGKSTTAPALLQGALGVTEFVNADVIAQGLSAFNPERAAFHAGRIMLERLQQQAEEKLSRNTSRPEIRLLSGVTGKWSG